MDKSTDQTNKTSKPWRWKGLGCLVVLIGIPLVYYGSYFALGSQRVPNPQIIAHRGGRAYAPENTLKAFRNAISLGVDYLELDVQRTRDGTLVVIHDATVDRTTNGVGSVKDLSLEQIRALDAGDGENIPTFKEVLQLAGISEVKLLPEAKNPGLYPGLGVEMSQAVIDAQLVPRTVIQSFDPKTMDEIHASFPQISLARLYGLWELSLRSPQLSESTIVMPMAEMVLLNPWMIKQAHDQGRKVFVWFGIIEHPLIMRLILALGADGLVVDDPIALKKILGR